MPPAPISSAFLTSSGSPLSILRRGTIPETFAALIMCSALSSLLQECSLSILQKSSPQKPISSTIAGLLE